MSRWVAASRSVVVRRVDPNPLAAWCCAVIAGVIPVIDLRLLVLAPAALLVVGPLQVVLVVLCAAEDDRFARRQRGYRRVSPLLAAVTPFLYLLVRMLRHDDPRAGRPLWTGVVLFAAAFVLNAFVNIGAYAASVHGF